MLDALSIIESELVPKVPGFSVAVAVDGKTVWSHQAGYMDLTAKKPVQATTRFRIGSVSKPLTAAGLALLVERGQLDLDAPVQKYIPDFADKGAIITPRMLAGHLSGIRNYQGTEAVSTTAYPNLRAGLKVFENDPLEAEPGTRFSYCSYNWNVLGVVMEAASGQDFLGFMGENVIQPLGLSNTRPDRAGVEDEQRALFYETTPDGKFIPAPPSDYSSKWPAGGYLSTAEDMARFGCAMIQPGFLKAESLRLLFTSQKIATGAPTRYGIGWFVGKAVVYHAGDSLGGTSILFLHPGSRTAVAVATNGGNVLLNNMLRKKRAPEEAAKLLVKKEIIAAKLASIFARNQEHE